MEVQAVNPGAAPGQTLLVAYQICVSSFLSTRTTALLGAGRVPNKKTRFSRDSCDQIQAKEVKEEVHWIELLE